MALHTGSFEARGPATFKTRTVVLMDEVKSKFTQKISSKTAMNRSKPQATPGSILEFDFQP